jgi:hypothetical protein
MSRVVSCHYVDAGAIAAHTLPLAINTKVREKQIAEIKPRLL